MEISALLEPEVADHVLATETSDLLEPEVSVEVVPARSPVLEELPLVLLVAQEVPEVPAGVLLQYLTSASLGCHSAC